LLPDFALVREASLASPGALGFSAVEVYCNGQAQIAGSDSARNENSGECNGKWRSPHDSAARSARAAISLHLKAKAFVFLWRPSDPISTGDLGCN
jgi:hypothetical protein